MMKSGHNDLCVGIDLGTTNSVLATINERGNGDIISKVVDIPRAVDSYTVSSSAIKMTTKKDKTLPSCVYYREEDDYKPLIGDYAKRQYPLRPHLVAKSIKSQMGKPYVEGLSEEIPDKTPAKVSANILKHMITQASKIYRCKIEDAIITVPANFDTVMCKATKDAAQLAGIKVTNEDGSERPILLSEPNAVIYDLINQIHNGEISNHIIDLSEKKNVLVFDLGGGTLDITMHEIKRREEASDILKVSEIATNRYTLLGGDDFDEKIAQAMYERYLQQYRNHKEIVKQLKEEKNVIMPQLRNYAEQLKIDLNERVCNAIDSNYNDFGWDDEDEMTFPIGGHMGGIGFSYDDTFTQEEVEEILECYMGNQLSIEDYKRIDEITSKSDTNNIIYPILDVLSKAARKLGTKDVIVDEVIVNGGMSKFYMVTERLKKFFGFDPIVALDPDQAVARGAAVYHYYLHKYEQIQDNMRLLGDTIVGQPNSTKEDKQVSDSVHNKNLTVAIKGANVKNLIEWGKNILNDSLYLGVKNNIVHKIIPTGAELPYSSGIQSGFRLLPGQNMIAIPIKCQNIDGTYRTIAQGTMKFKNRYPNGAYVAFEIIMSSNKVITMNAWTSKDENGNEKIEEGKATIEIDNTNYCKSNLSRMVAPKGATLDTKAEISNLIQLCRNMDKSKGKKGNSNLAGRIKAQVSTIIQAGNRKDFANDILYALKQNMGNESIMERLFTIARKIGYDWDPKDKKELAKLCLEQLAAEIHGLGVGGRKVCTDNQAIYALSMCGTTQQIQLLAPLYEKTQYLQACLYTCATTRINIDWVYTKFKQDVHNVLKGFSSNLQFSAYAIGSCLRKEDDFVSELDQEEVVDYLCQAIRSGKLLQHELGSCLIALGCICDQRMEVASQVHGIALDKALNAVRNLTDFYSVFITMNCEKIKNVVIKMIEGFTLDEEEQLLLMKMAM